MLLSPAPAEAQTQTITLGLDPTGWEYLATDSLSNVLLVPGFRGAQDIVIVPESYRMGPNTDLLLSFDDGISHQGAGYSMVASSGTITEATVARGTGAFAVDGEAAGMILRAAPGALFGAGNVWGDTTIEFWLYPSAATDGEVILSWEGSRVVEGGTEPQSIYVDIAGQRLRWSFGGVFGSPEADGSLAFQDLSISGIRRLIPDTWQHHLFRFDAESGLMEYLVDGVPEAVRYATPSGREGGEIFTAALGAGGRELLRIAPDFRGIIDDLRISRDFVVWDPSAATPHQRFVGTRGVAELRGVPLGVRGGRVGSIDVGTRGSPGSEVWTYYRMQDLSGAPGGEWLPFESGEMLSPEARGRFVDIRLELYPDVQADESPRVTDIAIVYEPDEAPVPPQRVVADPESGGVRLSWSPTYEEDVAGYLVFYGTRPGSYFGRDAVVSGGVEGDSPIDVGMTREVLVTGLEPGRMYFFAVAAYDELGRTRPGVLSSEVSARPGAPAR